MLGPITENIPTRLEPLLELRYFVRLIPGTVREWNLNIVVVEDVGLDEKISE